MWVSFCLFFLSPTIRIERLTQMPEALYFLCVRCVNPFANRFIEINAKCEKNALLLLFCSHSSKLKIEKWTTRVRRENSLSSVYDTKGRHRWYRKNKRNHTLHMLFLHSSHMKYPEAKPRQTHDIPSFFIRSIQLYLLWCVRGVFCVFVLALFLFICGTFSQIT